MRPWLAYWLLAFIWGTTWLAIKFVVREMPPLSAAGARFLLAAALLAAFAALRSARSAGRRWTSADRWLLLALSFLMIAVPYGLVFYGELTVSSALAAVLFACHPAFVLLFDSLVSRRNLFTRPRVAGLTLAFTGLLILFWPRLGGGELGGAVALVAAAASSAAAMVLAKHRAQHIEALGGTAWQMAGGGAWLLVAGLVFERPALAGYTPTALAALLYLTVFGSCVTFVVYYDLLKRVAPVQLSTLSFVIPVIAAFVGWLVLDERLAGASLAGAVVALVGVALLHWPEPAPVGGGD
jgi:drug/metabolite transporter (DMT)-like permease